MQKTYLTALTGGAFVLMLPTAGYSEITILDKHSIDNSLIAPLSVSIGGSIRPEWIWTNGREPNHYNDRGHDGGSRLRFHTDYALSDHTAVIGYYEWGIDFAHALGMHGNYSPGGDRDRQRQLYAGIRDDRYGTLTYGHQYGIYYSVVGIKSDVWDNDGHAGATAIGFNGNFDGANKPKNSVMYKNTFGPVTLYANYLLPEDEARDGAGFSYRRNHGAGIGLDYAITPKLTWGAAYSSTEATLKRDPEQKKSQQQISGTALTWQPGNWYLNSTASYYKNFVPSTRERTVHNYFAGSGYGLEAFGGYTFNIDKPLLKSVQPYLAADTLRLKGRENYHSNHTYIGVGTTVAWGLSVYLERTIAASSDDEADSTWLTFFFDF